MNHSSEVKQQVIELYNDRRRAPEVARKLHLSTSAVYKILEEAGIPRNIPRYRKLSSEQEIELMTAYQAGEAVPPLLEKYQINAVTLRNIRLRHGVLPRNRPSNWNRLHSDETEQEVIKAYLSGKSQAQIAKELGVGQSWAAEFLHRRGIVSGDLRPRRENHGKWKGGRTSLSGGYVGVRLDSDDPYLGLVNSGGYALEHRYVVSQALGRTLHRSETVHHINGDKTDNRLENLQLRQGKHGRGAAMACLDCGSHNIGPVPLG